MATQHYITPDAPANPYTNGKQEVPIAPVSAWAAGCVSSVLAFPTALDQARLERAFARAASFWPSVVGRYVKSSQPGPEFAVSASRVCGNGEAVEGPRAASFRWAGTFVVALVMLRLIEHH
jgi:hypothetical protein